MDITRQQQLDSPEGQHAFAVVTAYLDKMGAEHNPTLCDPALVNFTAPRAPKKRQSWFIASIAVSASSFLLALAGGFSGTDLAMIVGVVGMTVSTAAAMILEYRAPALAWPPPETGPMTVARIASQVRSHPSSRREGLYPKLAAMLSIQCFQLETLCAELEVPIDVIGLYRTQLTNIYRVSVNAELVNIDQTLLARAYTRLVEDLALNQLLIANLEALQTAREGYENVIAAGIGNAELENLLGETSSSLNTSIDDTQGLLLQIQALGELLELTP